MFRIEDASPESLKRLNDFLNRIEFHIYNNNGRSIRSGAITRDQLDGEIDADKIYGKDINIPSFTGKDDYALTYDEQTGAFGLNVKPIPSADVLTLVYPVGSIYISVNATNPGAVFGGTWAAFGTGRTLVGVDTEQVEFNTPEETGGEKSHTLSVSELPAHKHNANLTGLTYTGTGGTDSWFATGTDAIQAAEGDAGSGAAHNNLQPYITVYMWKRLS